MSDATLCSMRLQHRNWNRAHITELGETFRILPRLNGQYPDDTPASGELLREANRMRLLST
jgi:hypothetical protein